MWLSGRGLAAADLSINLLLITPLVQMHQWSTWALCELLPFSRHGNACFVTVLAATMEVLIMLAQHLLESRCKSVESRAALALWYRVYIYVLAVCNAGHAWGVTVLSELYAGSELQAALLVVASGACALWCLSCGRNILGNPFNVEADNQQTFCGQTMFGTEVEYSAKRLLDAIFTVAVIYSGVAYLWYGIWTVYDRVVFPDNPPVAMATCLCMGYLGTAAFLHMQEHASHLSRNLEERSARQMVFFEDVFLLSATAFSVMLCKGLWMFYEELIQWYPVYAGQKDVSLWAYHFTAFAVLAGCQCSGSLLTRGVERDGTYTGGQGVKFTTTFLGCIWPEPVEENSKDKEQKDKVD